MQILPHQLEKTAVWLFSRTFIPVRLDLDKVYRNWKHFLDDKDRQAWLDEAKKMYEYAGVEVEVPTQPQCLWFQMGFSLSWVMCEQCGRPAWEHSGIEVLNTDNIFGKTSYRDFTDEERNKLSSLREKWEDK